MPYAPLNTKCRELGCKNQKTSRSTFCSEHGGGVTEKGRENQKLYNTTYWKRQRIAQLSKNPLCARCLLDGKVTIAEHIDHVFPHRQDDKKFRVNLFQSLCQVCHTYKTIDESKGIYNHYTSNRLITYTDADYVSQIANKTESTQNL